MAYQVSEQTWLEKFGELEKWRRANRNAHKVSGPVYQKVLEQFGIPQGSSVLDVGCGEGVMRECLPADTQYFGIDPFPKVEAPCIKKGRAEAIPFGDETFDYVLCFASLFHFQDLNQSFGEMARVLRKGGQLLIIVIIKQKDEPPSRSHTFRITNRMMNELGDSAGLTWIFKKEVPELKSWLYGWMK